MPDFVNRILDLQIAMLTLKYSSTRLLPLQISMDDTLSMQIG